MTVLTLVNHKGGTGKTTSALHLAAAFGHAGYRVLLVDLDPQGFLTRTLGVEEPPPEQSSAVLFELNRSLRDVAPVPCSGFDLVPASMALTRLMRNLNKPADVLWAKDSLQQAPEGYDLVLLDTAAAVTVLSLNALVASQHCLIPVTPEHQPVLGAEQTFQTVKLVQGKLNPDLSDPLFLLTAVDRRKGTHAAYQQMLHEVYGPLVLPSVIRTSTSLSRTYPRGTTVFDHDVTGRGALDYANAADALGRVMQQGGLRTAVRGRDASLHATLPRTGAAPPEAPEAAPPEAMPDPEEAGAETAGAPGASPVWSPVE